MSSMRLLLACVVLAATAVPARAEIAKLGDLQLGQEVKKPTLQKVTLFGCAGSMVPKVDMHERITLIEFDGAACGKLVKSMTAAITKAFGGAPLVNATGDALWEGTTASIILTRSLSASGSPTVLLLPPGGGAKRVCWADDGFAAFWSKFKAAVASGKGKAITAAFAFPLRDFEDKVRFKTAKALAAKWKTIVGKQDIEELGAGKLTARCSLDARTYELSLDSDYLLTATRIDGVWHWSELDDRASG